MENIFKEEDLQFIKQVEENSFNIANEFKQVAKLKKGQIVVIGCSTSEVVGNKIGTHSTPEIASAIYSGLKRGLGENIYIAAQCCEHLNRAIVIEESAMPNAERVNVVPMPKAGGSFATICYEKFTNPIVVENIKADGGIDIGLTLIGMHLKQVAVPLRLSTKQIGKALVTSARVRPKFIGGSRACYDENLK